MDGLPISTGLEDEPVSSTPSSGEVDAKIAASEARSETKIVRLEGKLDLVLSRMDGIGRDMDNIRHDIRSSRATVIAVVVAVGIGIAALMATMFGSLPSFFGMSTYIHDLVTREVHSQVIVPPSPPEQRFTPVPPPPAGNPPGRPPRR